jgi:hypothetical protein
MANKQKFWRKSNAMATAAGFSRSNPDHRLNFTSKRQVRKGAARPSEEKNPSGLLVALFARVGLVELP